MSLILDLLQSPEGLIRVNASLRYQLYCLVMFEPFLIAFSHLISCIFLLPFRQYFNYEVKYANNYNYSHKNDNYVESGIISYRILVLLFIVESISLLRFWFFLAPISFFDVFDQWGHSFAEGLRNFADSCSCPTSSPSPVTTTLN